MLCQVCGSDNQEDLEVCAQCQYPLYVVSGPLGGDTTVGGLLQESEALSLDEHLLERVSILEEAVRKTAETSRRLLRLVRQQEEQIVVAEAAISGLRSLVVDRGIVTQDEWEQLFAGERAFRVASLEERDRLMERKEEILADFVGEDREEFLSRLLEADVALTEFDYPTAMDALKSAWILQKDNRELALFLAETALRAEHNDAALEFYQSVLKSHPDDPEALVNVGVLLYQGGASEEARAMLERSQEVAPDHFLSLLSLGVVYLETDRLKEALELLKRAVEIERVSQSLYAYACCHHALGHPKKTVDLLKETVQMDPTYEEAYHLLGTTYLELGWRTKALETFREALDLNPRRLRYLDLVERLSRGGRGPSDDLGQGARVRQTVDGALRSGKPEIALEAYTKALESDHVESELRLEAVSTAYRLGRADLVQAWAQSPTPIEDALIRVTLSMIRIAALRDRKDIEGANLLARNILAEEESSWAQAVAFEEMAWNILEDQGDLEVALGYAQSSVELAPEELYPFSLMILGWVQYHRGEFDKAVESLGRASEGEADRTTLTHLGLALLAAGREEEAREILTVARETDEGRGLIGRMLEFIHTGEALVGRTRSGRGE